MSLDIFVPYWGDPALLRETVDSVLAQTSDDWTLTVVDDAYDDPAAGAYVTGLDHEHVRYVRNETNVGITENYRRCLGLASADLVVFLGCDDLLGENYVATVLEAAEHYAQATVIQPGVEVVDADGHPTASAVDQVKRLLRPRGRAPRLLAGESAMVTLMRGNWLYWPSLVFRRDAVVSTGFRDDFPYVQDLALVVDILMDSGSLLYVPDVCFSYRRHRASASSTSLFDGSRFDGERRYFAIAADEASRLGWTRAQRAARMHATSRAHAAALLLAAGRARDGAAMQDLLRHVFAPTPSELS
ncbi:MAG: glycosyltransferase [Micrococcales bacterium]|nr:glycosyltransferase [Micrococcales bacterium]MCL2668516.1 glycosyltransferase [Micrococcales bacterium]